MRENPGRGGKETTLDRVVAGVVSALVMLAALAAIAFLAVTNGARDSFSVFRAFHMWGAILVAGSFVAGLVLGPRRMVRLVALLWGSEVPDREWFSALLWMGVVLIVAISYVLAK
ncbi:MAG TPA: hypothetical protein VFP36_00960 [Usitatibacter sp.]|nr:hypothetical protein [Usitatibacter sp.]